jgi:hypothetical protein
MKIKVEVTEKDIKRGKPVSCSGCPIALAFRRATKTTSSSKRMKYVDVSGGYVGFVYKNDDYWVDLPRRAQNFIHKFDLGKSVKPFSFVVKFNPYT